MTTTISNIFHGSRLKIQRAQHHINELEKLSAIYCNDNPALFQVSVLTEPVFIDGKFSSFEVSFASRVGFGASYSLYKLVNDQPYNVYSFAAQLSLATAERPNMGILLTASAFDLYGLSPSVGIGYDFVKDSPIKQNWFLMWGLGKTF